MRDDTMFRMALRIAAALLGLAAAVPALLIPILVYLDESSFQKAYPSVHRLLWPAVAFYTSLFIPIALLVALAYLLLRYAMTNPHFRAASGTKRRADSFFKSLAVASTAIIVLSIAAQLCFAVVETFRIKRNFPDWRPQFDWISLWKANTHNSPVFLLPLWVVFICAFYWEYRRSTHAEK